MADLYRVMVHDPNDVCWEDDSFASGWTTITVDLVRDGDVAEMTVQGGYTEGYMQRASLSIDASTYNYMIICLKGDGEYKIVIHDGAYKTVQDWTAAPSDYEVKVFDLSGVTTGTINTVRIYVGQAAGRELYVDFVAFVKRVPQFLQDIMELRVHQRESDLDTFELMVDSKGPVEDDTVLLLHFDEGLGNKVFDESGYENHGVLHGPSWVNGRSGKALEFDGASDYVEIPHSSSLAITDAITVECWAKADVWDGHYWRKGALWELFINPTYHDIRVYFRIDGNWRGGGTGYIPDLGRWYHLVARYDSASRTIKVFIDGEERYSNTLSGLTSYTIETSETNLYIGAVDDVPIDPFDGVIDEVRIHNRALSEGEIKESYRRGLPHRVLVHGRHIRVWLDAVKVFAGIIEEATLEEGGGLIRANGRCFGQKLLLKTKSKSWSGREVSLAVKDLVEDLSEITTLNVESPSPVVTVTKDVTYEYIMDGLKDLAHHVGEGWEVKLGMGQDLRFRSRSSSNVPAAPVTLQEGVNVLRGVRRESDALRLYNKVTVIGGARSNPNGDPDCWTDSGDASSWTTDASAGVSEDTDEFVQGTCSIKIAQPETPGVVVMYGRYDMGASGVDLTPFEQFKFHHKTDSGGIQRTAAANWKAEVRLTDTSGRAVSKTYLDDVQPPRVFAEVVLELSDFSGDVGFDWSAVRYLEFRLKTDDGQSEIWGNYWIDKVHLYVANIKATATDSSSTFKYTREYILRNEKLVDPDFIREVATALLTTLKEKENRYRVPVSGGSGLQVGQKVSVDIPSHGLSGTYYIAEVEHRLTSNGLVTDVVLEKPTLSLEALLAESIGRRISLIERGGIK